MKHRAKPDLAARLSIWWRQKSPPARLYLAGATAFIVAIVCLLLSKAIGSWVFSFGVLLFCLGIFWECYAVVIAAKDRPLAKVFIAILTVMAAALATGAASAVIAAATKQDPSSFKTAITFISPLAFVPVFAIIAFALSLCAIPLMLILGVREPKESNGALLLGRLVGLIGIMAFSQTLLRTDSGFSKFLDATGAYSAYLLDMHEDPSCSSTEGDRISRVNDNVVIIGRVTDAGPQFLRVACALGPESAALAPPKRVDN